MDISRLCGKNILFQAKLKLILFSFCLTVGDRCDLRDGSQGVCENFQDCPQALKDFKKGVLIKVCLSKVNRC